MTVALQLRAERAAESIHGFEAADIVYFPILEYEYLLHLLLKL